MHDNTLILFFLANRWLIITDTHLRKHTKLFSHRLLVPWIVNPSTASDRISYNVACHSRCVNNYHLQKKEHGNNAKTFLHLILHLFCKDRWPWSETSGFRWLVKNCCFVLVKISFDRFMKANLHEWKEKERAELEGMEST